MDIKNLLINGNKLVNAVLTVTLVFTAFSLRADNTAPVLEEVVVTAQKRAENLQDVPISISAFGAQQLERERIFDVQSVAERTPGFYIGNRSTGEPELTIRGIGSTDREAGSDRSVAVVVDEVYIARAGGSTIDAMDLERVEVLRGPQGTLFGRNIVGGAIHFITKKPSADRYTKLIGTIGNERTYEVGGVVNGALTEKLFGRVSFQSRQHDGYNTNIITGNDVDGLDRKSIRGALKYVASADLDLLLTFDYVNDDDDGIGARWTDGSTGLTTGAGFTNTPDFHELATTIDGFLKRDIWGITFRADWQTPLGVFTSLTSYRDVDFTEDKDGGFSTGPDFSSRANLDNSVYGFNAITMIDETDKAFSQELRLTSDSDGPLKWVGGLYFYSEKTDRYLERPRVLSLPGSITSSHIAFDQHNDTDSYALFGQVSYDFLERFTLTVGGRYTHDHKHLDLEVIDLDPGRTVTNSLNPALEPFAVSVGDNFSKFTPMASLKMSLFEDTMMYFTWSEGWKSGGFNAGAGDRVTASVPFAPEKATSYEAGLKSRFWNNRASLNLSAYRLEFQDLQLRRRVLTRPGDQSSNTVLIANAAEAVIKGIEVEAMFVPVKDLTFSAAYAYMDTAITDPTLSIGDAVDILPAFDPDGLIAIKGTALPRAPKNFFSVTANYVYPLSSGGSLELMGAYRWRDKVYADLGEPQREGFEPSFGISDASATWYSPGHNWHVKLWIKNIADKEYYTFREIGGGGAFAGAVVGDPRTYGITVGWETN